MPTKKHQKQPFRAKERAYDFSNPSGSTFKPLTVNRLAVITDNLLTKKQTRENNPIFEVMRSNYKKAVVYDGGGDLKKQWFVYYSYRNPETGKMQRFKHFGNINQGTTKAERYDLANLAKTGINELLADGESPFKKSEMIGDGDKNIISCIDNFLKFIEGGKLRKNTKRKYKIELTVFKEWLKTSGLFTLKIGEIKKQYIFEFVEYVKKRNIKSGKTVNHYLNDIRRFFNHYIDNYDDYLERNPASKITRDPVEERGNIAFTQEEFEAIRSYILVTDPYLWFVCQVIYYTGLRNEAEALEVKIGDFDLSNNLLFVEAWVAKNKIRQSITIYPEFMELLNTLNLSSYPPEWYLFGRNDKPGPVRVGVDNFARRFRPVKKHFGLGAEYGLYCFKSTRACHLFDDGAPIRDIQMLFRHSDLYVTMKYLKSLGRVERGRVYDKGRSI